MLRGVLLLIGFGLLSNSSFAADSALRSALRFHASFDTTVDADTARGDNKLYTATTLKREDVRAGLHTDAIIREASNGRYGGCLHFLQKSENVIYYQGRGNVPFDADGFAGTVSLWMQLTPAKDLPDGYVDPLQITDKKWNDASLFLDFTDKNPRQFRLGVFADYPFWNPKNRNWDDIPDAERPLIPVAQPPFSAQRWTHVAFTWSGFNQAQSRAKLYLDGKLQGELAHAQQLTWDPTKVVMMLGIYYVGRIDDFAVFDRALSAEEIEQLRNLPAGIKSLNADR